jgi:hypothetical protein
VEHLLQGSLAQQHSTPASAIDAAAAGVSAVRITPQHEQSGQQQQQQQQQQAHVHQCVLVVGLPGAGHPAVIPAISALITAQVPGSHVVGVCLPSNCGPHAGKGGMPEQVRCCALQCMNCCLLCNVWQ